MSRQLTLLLFSITILLGAVGLIFAPESALIAQAPAEPEYPFCPVEMFEVARFGPDSLIRPDKLEASYDFDIAPGYGPEGEVRVWQGEGHLWDLGCNAGSDNDGGGEECDQNQLQEVITFTVNATAIGQFVDHSPDTDNNYLYTFAVDTLVEGSNQLGLHHLNQGTGANSVFYKGVVCAVAVNPPTATATTTSTPTSTSTPTPTNTLTPTPTETLTIGTEEVSTCVSVTTDPVLPDALSAEGIEVTVYVQADNPQYYRVKSGGAELLFLSQPFPLRIFPERDYFVEVGDSRNVCPIAAHPTGLDVIDQPKGPGLAAPICLASNCLFLPVMRAW